MKCHAQSVAKPTRLWDMVMRGIARTVLPKPCCDAALRQPASPPQKSGGAPPTPPWSDLPMTQRAAEWQAVRHLDENAARRRAVIAANRKALEKTLGKGACSDD